MLASGIWTLHIRLVHVFPSVLATDYILDILALHGLALKVSLVENVLVGTAATFEAVGANQVVRRTVCACHDGRYCEHVAARGAEE